MWEYTLLQVKINFNSPYVDYDSNAYYMYPNGVIYDGGDGVYWDSCGYNLIFAGINNVIFLKYNQEVFL